MVAVSEAPRVTVWADVYTPPGGEAVTAGAVVSMVHVALAGVGSGLPAGSVAVTVKLWVPSARPVKVAGVVQVEASALSRMQVKVAGSLAENVNVAAVVLTVPVGPVSMTVFGAVVSGGAAVVNDQISSAASGLPETSCTPLGPPSTVVEYVVVVSSGASVEGDPIKHRVVRR